MCIYLFLGYIPDCLWEQWSLLGCSEIHTSVSPSVNSAVQVSLLVFLNAHSGNRWTDLILVCIVYLRAPWGEGKVQDSAEADTVGQVMLQKVWDGASLEIVWSHTDKEGVYLTKSRNHYKLVRSFYYFGFVWNSDPSPVLFSGTWLLSSSLLDGHSPAQRLPSALGYFGGVRVWCMRGENPPLVSWMTGRRGLSPELQDLPRSNYSHFVEKMRESHQLLSCCVCAQLEQHFCLCSAKVGCLQR